MSFSTTRVGCLRGKKEKKDDIGGEMGTMGIVGGEGEGRGERGKEGECWKIIVWWSKVEKETRDGVRRPFFALCPIQK